MKRGMNCVHGREQGIGCPHCHGYSGQAFPAPQVDAAHEENAMATALIERLRGELGEAVALLKRHVGSTKPPTKDSPCPATVSCACCDTHLFLESLAASPPAESTPVCTACPGPALLGACSHPGCEVNKESREVGRMLRENDKAGLAAYLNRNVADKAKIAVERIKAAPPDDIRAFTPPLTAREWMMDHERRLAALEAKGEPGTLMHVDREALHRYLPCTDDGERWRCFICGNPDDSSLHPKGAKP